MAENQLEIAGIGQQKATLSDWKKENKVYTHNSMLNEIQGMDWTAWDETEMPGEYLNRYGMDAFGYGKTEKAAILDLCDKDQDIKPPFWW